MFEKKREIDQTLVGGGITPLLLIHQTISRFLFEGFPKLI